MNSRLARFLVIVQLVVTAPLAAQDTTRVVTDSVARAQRARELARVIVLAKSTRPTGYGTVRSRTATKTDISLLNTPQSISIVTRGLIADQAMQSMADVVRYVPGISMGQGEGHRDAPTIRGQSSTADFFVDGVRDDAQYLRDLYNVDRVEALKGSNAMMFGRGGGGGIINRVTKEATWSRVGAVTLEGGSFAHKRGSLDLGGAMGALAAGRVNAMHENSGGFRRGMRLERTGINPEASLALSARTTARVGYEYFADDRTVDRGVPSYKGAPFAEAGRLTFFGDPAASPSHVRVDAAHVTLSHLNDSGVTFRNTTRLAAYDKFYQNVYPNSAVGASGTQVSLAAYNATTYRRNVFNQTDVTGGFRTGLLRHTLLVGAEFGRQGTDNARNTGYFNNSATAAPVSTAQPTPTAPITYRQSASDADNHVNARVAAAYVQDQVALGEHWLALAGVRVDQFAVTFHNNRSSTADLTRDDRLVSPRMGLVFKPVDALSFYATQSVSSLPSSGDQFSALSATTQTLEPERFTNREVGAKWDPLAALSLSLAAYRLDRTNTVAPDPARPERLVQTGSQRVSGLEAGAAGNLTARWQVAAGFAAQRARIVTATTAARTGATIPLVPDRTASLWNKVQLAPRFALGLGIVRQSEAYAAIDNTVILPAFTRADAAAYLTLRGQLRAQLNVENLANSRYYSTSHGNNNIMPGAPRTVRISLTAGL